MIVDQGHGADHAGFGRLPGLLHELIADEVAEGFGAVGVTALGDELVELIQKLGIDSNANPAEAAHSYQIIRVPSVPPGGTNLGIVLLWRRPDAHTGWISGDTGLGHAGCGGGPGGGLSGAARAAGPGTIESAAAGCDGRVRVRRPDDQ